jgi:hypothetical protein
VSSTSNNSKEGREVICARGVDLIKRKTAKFGDINLIATACRTRADRKGGNLVCFLSSSNVLHDAHKVYTMSDPEPLSDELEDLIFELRARAHVVTTKQSSSAVWKDVRRRYPSSTTMISLFCGLATRAECELDAVLIEVLDILGIKRGYTPKDACDDGVTPLIDFSNDEEADAFEARCEPRQDGRDGEVSDEELFSNLKSLGVYTLREGTMPPREDMMHKLRTKVMSKKPELRPYAFLDKNRLQKMVPPDVLKQLKGRVGPLRTYLSENGSRHDKLTFEEELAHSMLKSLFAPAVKPTDEMKGGSENETFLNALVMQKFSKCDENDTGLVLEEFIDTGFVLHHDEHYGSSTDGYYRATWKDTSVWIGNEDKTRLYVYIPVCYNSVYLCDLFSLLYILHAHLYRVI